MSGGLMNTDALEVVFTSPEDERWRIVKWGPVNSKYTKFGLSHLCSSSPERDQLSLSRGSMACSYCGAKPPKALTGMYKLVEWEK